MAKRAFSYVFMIYVNVICEKDNIKLGLMGFTSGHSHVVFLGKIGAAVSVAIDKVNHNDTILGNFALNFTMMDTVCNVKLAL